MRKVVISLITLVTVALLGCAKDGGAVSDEAVFMMLQGYDKQRNPSLETDSSYEPEVNYQQYNDWREDYIKDMQKSETE